MSKVTIEVDMGDAISAYGFLRETVQRVYGMTRDMPSDRQEVYREQPDRWDRIAIALGEAAGEVDLPTFAELEAES